MSRLQLSASAMGSTALDEPPVFVSLKMRLRVTGGSDLAGNRLRGCRNDHCLHRKLAVCQLEFCTCMEDRDGPFPLTVTGVTLRLETVVAGEAATAAAKAPEAATIAPVFMVGMG